MWNQHLQTAAPCNIMPSPPTPSSMPAVMGQVVRTPTATPPAPLTPSLMNSVQLPQVSATPPHPPQAYNAPPPTPSALHQPTNNSSQAAAISPQENCPPSMPSMDLFLQMNESPPLPPPPSSVAAAQTAVVSPSVSNVGTLGAVASTSTSTNYPTYSIEGENLSDESSESESEETKISEKHEAIKADHEKCEVDGVIVEGVENPEEFVQYVKARTLKKLYSKLAPDIVEKAEYGIEVMQMFASYGQKVMPKVKQMKGDVFLLDDNAKYSLHCNFSCEKCCPPHSNLSLKFPGRPIGSGNSKESKKRKKPAENDESNKNDASKGSKKKKSSKKE